MSGVVPTAAWMCSSSMVDMNCSFAREKTAGSPGSSGSMRSGRSRRSGSKSSLTTRSSQASLLSVLSPCSLPLGVREFAESSPSPVEARPHGADRHAEGVGDILVAQRLPDMQDERVALRLRAATSPPRATRCQRAGGVDVVAHTARRDPTAAAVAPRAAPPRGCGGPRADGASPAGSWRCRRATGRAVGRRRS